MTTATITEPLESEGHRGFKHLGFQEKLGFSGYFRHKAPGKNEDLGSGNKNRDLN